MFSLKFSTECLNILQISPNHVIFNTILHWNWCFCQNFPKNFVGKNWRGPWQKFHFFVKYSPVQEKQDDVIMLLKLQNVKKRNRIMFRFRFKSVQKWLSPHVTKISSPESKRLEGLPAMPWSTLAKLNHLPGQKPWEPSGRSGWWFGVRVAMAMNLGKTDPCS